MSSSKTRNERPAQIGDKIRLAIPTNRSPIFVLRNDPSWRIYVAPRTELSIFPLWPVLRHIFWVWTATELLATLIEVAEERGGEKAHYFDALLLGNEQKFPLFTLPASLEAKVITIPRDPRAREDNPKPVPGKSKRLVKV